MNESIDNRIISDELDKLRYPNLYLFPSAFFLALKF